MVTFVDNKSLNTTFSERNALSVNIITTKSQYEMNLINRNLNLLIQFEFIIIDLN